MQIVVWDLPLRLFHWLLALCVTGALVTVSLGGNWMVWHERFGLSVLGLLTFRLVWGLVLASAISSQRLHVFPSTCAASGKSWGTIRSALSRSLPCLGSLPFRR